MVVSLVAFERWIYTVYDNRCCIDVHDCTVHVFLLLLKGG